MDLTVITTIIAGVCAPLIGLIITIILEMRKIGKDNKESKNEHDKLSKEHMGLYQNLSKGQEDIKSLTKDKINYIAEKQSELKNTTDKSSDALIRINTYIESDLAHKRDLKDAQTDISRDIEKQISAINTMFMENQELALKIKQLEVEASKDRQTISQLRRRIIILEEDKRKQKDISDDYRPERKPPYLGR